MPSNLPTSQLAYPTHIIPWPLPCPSQTVNAERACPAKNRATAAMPPPVQTSGTRQQHAPRIPFNPAPPGNRKKSASAEQPPSLNKYSKKASSTRPGKNIIGSGSRRKPHPERRPARARIGNPSTNSAPTTKGSPGMEPTHPRLYGGKAQESKQHPLPSLREKTCTYQGG